MKKTFEDKTVAVVGLGYVGLPLALALGRTKIKTIGFDVKKDRIDELKNGTDSTEEISKKDIKSSKLILTYDPQDIKIASFYIIAVPTPVDAKNEPDMSLVLKASETVGKVLKKGDIVVYESTVYPGATEEDCVPVLEKVSGLKWKKDFNVGYSPERINPGDKEHTLEKVIKIVSGDTEESTKRVASVYKKVCKAGVHAAPNIKTAEAAKVIENTQRDINIALMNELSIIFHKMNINTMDVLRAAGTKWNFLKFTPGLVGGHCIGVDPYYLVHKAKKLGYESHVITAGRTINDYMPQYVVDILKQTLELKGKYIKECSVLVAGLTFKENVKDYRNSKILSTIKILKNNGAKVTGYDPLLDEGTIEKEFGIREMSESGEKFDILIIAVPHNKMNSKKTKLQECIKNGGIIFDIKNRIKLSDQNNITYLSL